MRKHIVLFVATLLIASVAGAAELPPGKWWRNPALAQNLALSGEQQQRLDDIFRASANELIDERAEIEKLAIALRGELDRQQLNRQNLQRIASALTVARGRLFERELMMLADMRGALTDEQWARLRARLDRRDERPLFRRRR
jgi:hypothetical protein